MVEAARERYGTKSISAVTLFRVVLRRGEMPQSVSSDVRLKLRSMEERLSPEEMKSEGFESETVAQEEFELLTFVVVLWRKQLFVLGPTESKERLVRSCSI
jgi:hypothetical protein